MRRRGVDARVRLLECAYSGERERVRKREDNGEELYNQN